MTATGLAGMVTMATQRLHALAAHGPSLVVGTHYQPFSMESTSLLLNLMILTFSIFPVRVQRQRRQPFTLSPKPYCSRHIRTPPPGPYAFCTVPEMSSRSCGLRAQGTASTCQFRFWGKRSGMFSGLRVLDDGRITTRKPCPHSSRSCSEVSPVGFVLKE